MRAAVVRIRDSRAKRVPITIFRERQNGAHGTEAQDAYSHKDQSKHGHLDFLLLYFLAEILGRPAHHQPRNEYRENGEKQHSIETRPNSAENDFASFYIEERDESADRRKAVVHTVYTAVAGVGRSRGPESRA